MKFGKIMQLWITGLIFLMPVSAYADDENILTISPSGDTGPGIYEITISGNRDSDTAIVREYSADIRILNCYEGEGSDCHQSVTVIAAIAKGKNPGKSTYQQKFRIILEADVYSFSYLLAGEGDNGEYYKTGTVIIPHDNIFQPTDMLFVIRRPPISLSLQNAAAEISGTDSFTLRNLACETTDSQGSKQEFSAWGNFKWNPDTLSFELKDAGLQ